MEPTPDSSNLRSNESENSREKLSVRIVNVDYYLSKPIAALKDPCYSAFRSSPIYHVPVIRIFGPTSEGIKTCLHIHGVFPWVFLPNWDDEISDDKLYEFAQTLDHRINISFGNSTSKTMHVYRITKVWRRPFYGYHEKEKQFLKLEFYNPAMIKRATELLQNGAVFNMCFQPYEAHVPYILGFLIDNNLYGMSYINLSSYRTRSSDSIDPSIQLLDDNSIDGICKQSYCVFEIDASINDVCDINQNEDKTPNNPGLAFIWEEEQKLRRKNGRVSQITPASSQSRPKRNYTRTELYFKNKIAEKLHPFKNNLDSSKATQSFPESDDFTLDLSQYSSTTSDSKSQTLNTQCHEILAIMEEIATDSMKTSQQHSQQPLGADGSPSLNLTDDDELQPEAVDVSLISSQPLLKPIVEEDSILGCKFSSDDELGDVNDHLIMSQPLHARNGRDFSSCSDSSDSECCRNIPQLDGATSDSSRSNGHRRRATSLQKSSTAKKLTYSKKSYNNARPVDACSQHATAAKNSPCKNQYPQLQIDTQKSPKSSSRVRDAALSSSPTTSSSNEPPRAANGGNVSPRSNEPSRKRVPYPQLEVNIRKSPKSEAARRFACGEKKRRKLDFESCSSESVSTGGSASGSVATPSSFDVTSLTARWKKLRLSKLSKNRSVDGGACRISCSRSTDDLWDEILDKSPPLWSTAGGPQSEELSCRSTVSGGERECEANVDYEALLADVRSRQPCVKLVRVRTTNANRAAGGQPCEDGAEPAAARVENACERFRNDDVESSVREAVAAPKTQRRRLGVRMTRTRRAKADGETCATNRRLFAADDRRSELVARTNVRSASAGREAEGESAGVVTGEDEDAIVLAGKNIAAAAPQEDSGQFSDICLELRPDTEDGTASGPPSTGSPSFVDSPANDTDEGNVDDVESAATRKMADEVNFSEIFSFDESRVTADGEAEQTNRRLASADSSPVKSSPATEAVEPNGTADRSPGGDGANESAVETEDGWPRTPVARPVDAMSDGNVSDSIVEDNEDDRICSFYCNATSQMDAGSSPIIESSTDEIGSQKEEGARSAMVRVAAHSTPRAANNESAERRRRSQRQCSSSPNYTPILKKLAQNRMRRCDEGAAARRRIEGGSPVARRRDSLSQGDGEDRNESAGSAKNVSFRLPPIDERTNASIVTIDDTGSVGGESNDRRGDASVNSADVDTTSLNTYGFRMDLENLRNVKADAQYYFVTVVSMELFVETRLDLQPDPEYDAVRGLFYSVHHDAPNVANLVSGVIVVNDGVDALDVGRFSCEKTFVPNEEALYDRFVELIRQWDPDIFVGYEIEMLSWGYLIQRGKYLRRNCDEELSRVRETKSKIENNATSNVAEDDADYSADVKLTGRIVLNVWRLMRHEIALQSYTFENIVYHVLHQRVPHHSFRSLSRWWRSSLKRWQVVDYFLYRVENNVLLLQQLDLFGRTSELAKLFGIQFYEVLSRGSQFRVESMMLRLAKTQNFVAVSPSVKQRAAMRAPESLPLIMEPESKFYTDPVIVLDFQSLYPSIIIAYNYCFSTCLGRVQYLASDENFEFGCVRHTVSKETLTKLEPFLNYSPCGVAFVNKEVRGGVLPSMLEEILETRLMVKKSMKENKENGVLQRVLHARQLGLKLIANVTYGYTAANFSGRMPCIEVGDSVVSKGRETLERAIELITNNREWGARVIYGDTDSIFVMVPSRSKEAAFEIGSQIVEAVTNDNPKPVKLKLEKVYYPCILQTKKRYVGYMYESADQKEPTYDAKGIETVRRDGCPAVAKILEKCLKLLFESKKADAAKRYAQRQFNKIMSNQISIRELMFAREYRGMRNYKPTACVPALQIAKQAIMRDRRSEPRIKERVPYVLVVGAPGVPLINLVRTPRQFLENVGSIINAEYYITRVIIPALERCFQLMNVNVQSWLVALYKEMPKTKRTHLPIEIDGASELHKKTNIFHYFSSNRCFVCDTVAYSGVCRDCQLDRRRLAITIGDRVNLRQRNYNYLSKICGSCCGRGDSIECTSLDCPIFYKLNKSSRELEQVPYIEELQQRYLRIEIPDK